MNYSRMTTERVLGIDPGTRHLGMAVLEGHELVHAMVHELDGRSPQQVLSSARRHVQRLLSAYTPETVVIEKTYFDRGRHAPLLRLVTDEVESTARRRGMTVVLLAPSVVKKRITGHGHAGKDIVGKAVGRGFPQLRAYLAPDRKWKARYRSNLFDAIAIAASLEPGADSRAPATS